MVGSLFTEEIRRQIRTIAQRHSLRLVLAFGSAVSGKIHESSDMDIAVLTDEAEVSLKQFSDVAAELQGLFPGIEVDLVIINHADPLFLKKIVDDSELLYGDRRTFLEFKIYAYKRYVDHKPFLKMEKQFAVEQTKRLKRAAG